MKWNTAPLTVAGDQLTIHSSRFLFTWCVPRIIGAKAAPYKVEVSMEDIPFGFEQDVQRAQELEAQVEQDPQAIELLIRTYEQMLERLQPLENPFFSTEIQINLGIAYGALLTGDLADNLERAIACFQEALRFFTRQNDFAIIQGNLGLAYSKLPSGDRTNNLEKAIACFREALHFFTLEDTPFEYAAAQNSMGEAYYQLPSGDRNSNLEQAIACFQEALRFFTPENTPFEYATTQTNLGEANTELSSEDRTSDLEKAIACFREALRFWTPEIAPLDFAVTQTDLGLAYAGLSSEGQASNLERAIECFQQALRVYTFDEAPLDFALTQTYLAQAYREVPDGNRANNLEKAMACYRQALRVYTPEKTPSEYAAAQNSLGEVYRQLPIGDRTRNMERAIACFQQALRFRTPELAPFDYATTQHSLGNTYAELPTRDRTNNLSQSIACYREALRFFTPDAAPFEYAATQHNLGVAYHNLPTGNRAKNLEQAMACFQEAIHFWNAENADLELEYAQVQHSLGNAYAEFPVGNREDNLARALACYQEALRFRTPERVPFDYAATQNNLGEAYRQLPRDRASNLAQAIASYQQALRFFTPESAGFELEYAQVQHNLGNVYAEMPTGNQASNLSQAIAYYQEALRFRTPERVPLDYAGTQNNLGIAYTMIRAGYRFTHLPQAIACYREALRFRDPLVTPLDYAATQQNMGNAYALVPTGDRASNLRQAIACYREALRFYPLESVPFDYAMTQGNLGEAYSQLPAEYRTQHLREAIACFQEALRFYTPETAPYDCRKTTGNLAHLYFVQGLWQEALETYRAAIKISEWLYRAGLSTTSKEAEVRESAALYSQAAFAAVRCGETAEALLLLEQGKTRLLTEALHLQVRRPPGVPDEVWNGFEQAGDAVRAEQVPIRSEVPDSSQVYEKRLQVGKAANAALEAAIEDVHIFAPSFLAPLDRSSLEALLPDEQTALIAFCLTEQGSLGFVVSQHYSERVQVSKIPDFTLADLNRLFAEWDAEGRLTGGWVGAYVRSLLNQAETASEVWQGTITQVLATLGERLLAPLISALPAEIKRLILLPSAALFQFPLHAVPLAHNHATLLGDRYQVSYAPSLEVLAEARSKVGPDVPPELYAVINPEEDPKLTFTPFEGQAIVQLFAQTTVVTGHACTKARVLAGMTGRTYIHFSCHGTYEWTNPPASGLNLADDRLTLANLQQGAVDLSAARLVTLSACETGITDNLQGTGEEYIGIPAGLLLAGTPCVVSSLWAVPELSTALLMERLYYNHLKQRMDPAAALQEAQQWIRTLQIGAVAAYTEQCYQQAHPQERAILFPLLRYYRHQAALDPTQRPFAHPYYWAAFMVSGW